MIPAFTAMVELSQPVMITVDLGPNPQPGQTVPLPADIQIAGHMIHFDSATIEGDGVNSLRLTLTSAPIETKDDWMVSLLELGTGGDCGSLRFGFDRRRPPPQGFHRAFR